MSTLNNDFSSFTPHPTLWGGVCYTINTSNKKPTKVSVLGGEFSTNTPYSLSQIVDIIRQQVPQDNLLALRVLKGRVTELKSRGEEALFHENTAKRTIGRVLRFFRELGQKLHLFSNPSMELDRAYCQCLFSTDNINKFMSFIKKNNNEKLITLKINQYSLFLHKDNIIIVQPAPITEKQDVLVIERDTTKESVSLRYGPFKLPSSGDLELAEYTPLDLSKAIPKAISPLVQAFDNCVQISNQNDQTPQQNTSSHPIPSTDKAPSPSETSPPSTNATHSKGESVLGTFIPPSSSDLELTEYTPLDLSTGIPKAISPLVQAFNDSVQINSQNVQATQQLDFASFDWSAQAA